MSDLITMLSAASGAGGAETDPNFNQTVLLLHGDGTNGAQNNTFLDSSTNNFTITRNGNTTQGTFSPFSVGAGEWSNYFDGSGDYLDFVSSTNSTNFGTSDFTVEFWLYTTSFSAQQNVIDNLGGAQNAIYISTNGTIYWYVGANRITGTSAVSTNQWTHIALCRSSGTTRLFVDGTQVGSDYVDSNNYSGGSTYPRIGDAFNATAPTRGYISNFRVIKGTALYTGAFTPPTASLTAVSGTSLLTCQSNRFVDNSSNAFAITVNGNTSVQPFSPFAPSAAYSTSVNGGSGYFDGTGDYLTVPDDVDFAFGSGDFVAEAFIYRTATATQYVFMHSDNSTAGGTSFYLGISSSNKLTSAVYYAGSSFITLTSSANVQANEFTHIALVRSGGTISQYINGVRDGTNGTLSTNSLNDATVTIGIGARNNGGNPFAGYVSSVRIVKGSHPYDATSSTLTIPTAPLTAITNTSLLCNFTNAGIFDNTGKNNLETVGNAQIDTTTKKYGTGSMEFDGTGDRLSSVPSQNSVFGTGDFTIECWVYVSSFPASATPIVSNWAGANPAWILRFSSGSGNVGLTDNSSSFLSSSSAISLSTWTHIAVARSGTSLKMFFDGVEVASTTNSTSLGNASTGIHVGAYYNTTYPLAGFVDDLRITKGVARYTTTFTPPDKAFPDQ